MRTTRTITAAGPPRPGEDKERDATVPRGGRSKRMPANDLKAEWKTLFGTDAPNNSRGFLELRLAHRIQDSAYGGVARETTKLLNALADEVEGKPGRKSMIPDPRNPVVGTRLLREWNGAEHTTIVLRDGYEFEGRKYKSLSAIARDITGTRWNGYPFFGLRELRRDNQ